MKAALLILVGGISLLTGCIGFLPQPTMHDNYGVPVTRADVRFIQPGQTTRAEVISHLGTRYASLPRERALAYPWESKGLSFEWFFVAYGPYGGISEKTDCETSPTGARWQAYFVAFDDQGVVHAASFKNLTTNHKSLHEQLDHWAAGQHPPNDPAGGRPRTQP